ncbi:MAG: DUF4976 domain-containing protein, partial [Bryobacterales bacterium]|nr:DUF4976 domain-containing protein [Bryobacterales bacterium]
ENLKYVRRTKEWPSELYDLERDPGEKTNHADDPEYEKVKRSLDAELDGWFEKYGAPAQEKWRGTTKQNLTVYSR